MRKIWYKITAIIAAVAALVLTAVVIIKAKSKRAKSVIAENKGESFVDTAVKILIAIVIGALVLASLYLLFSGTIMPTLTSKIQEMFNYNG